VATMGPPGAGAMNRRVRFERRLALDPAGDGDGAGNFRGDWAPLGPPKHASLLPTRGGAEVIADRLQGQTVFDLWVYSGRLTRKVQVGDQVVDVNDPHLVYSVRSPPMDMDGRRRWLLMQVQEGVAS
jgi:hypothetical protein